jgi:hypothetical protein
MDGQQRRRLIALLIAGALLLIAGRWAASFLTERLWEAQVSESAALVGTRFALLRAGLDLAGVAIAVTWFVVHFLWATHSVLLQFGDLPSPLGTVSDRTAYAISVGAGVALGLAAGAGTGAWLGPLLLTLQDVRFGATDSLLQADLGTYLANLPLWSLLQERALALVVPALLGVTVLSGIGGTLRVIDGRPWISQRARWQLSILLVAAALVIGWGFALQPYHLAATRSALLGPSEFLLRATVAELEALFAATAAVLTFLWGARFKFVVALGGWVVLGLAVLGGTILVQSRATGGPLGPQELVTLRRVDTVAFGVRASTVARAVSDSLIPSLWDPEALSRLIETDSARVLDLLPGSVEVGGRLERVWFVLRDQPGSDISVLAVSDAHVGPSGGPASLRYGSNSFTPGLAPYLTLSRHNVRPRADEPDLDPAAIGVRLDSGVRRLVVAWALQVGAVLRAHPNQRIAWRLDPFDRLTAVFPFAQWSPPRLYVVDREIVWVSDGYLSAAEFPSSIAVPWRGEKASYLRAGFVGMVRARSGQARVFLRADADSLTHAWGRIAAPLVEPATALPSFIGDNLAFPTEWLAAQALVLEGQGWLGRPIARIGRSPYPIQDLATMGSLADPYRIPVMNDSGRDVVGVLVGPSGGDPPSTQLILADSTRSVPSPRELQQKWDRFPFHQQLRDSVRAAGSDYLAGLIRFAERGDTMVAYQPSYAIGAGGHTALVLVNVALADRLGAGRTYEEAWANLRGETAPRPVGTDLTERLTQAQSWIERADEALKRGDLQEFARAWSYLRELFRIGPSAPPAPAQAPEQRP